MATAASATSVSLAWNASTDNVGVASYVIDRKALNSAGWTQVWQGNALGYLDTAVVSSTMYQYRIRALDAANNYSDPATDFATTVIYEDDPIHEPYESGGTVIRGIHVARLREAIDAWRVFAGQSRSFTYGAATGWVTAADFTNMLSALNSARTALGLTPFAYANVAVPSARVVTVDDDHVQQLRVSMR